MSYCPYDGINSTWSSKSYGNDNKFEYHFLIICRYLNFVKNQMILMPIQHIFSYIMVRTSYFQWDDDEVHFVLDQHDELDIFNSANSLKQLSADRHVAPLRYITLILSQPVFALFR